MIRFTLLGNGLPRFAGFLLLTSVGVNIRGPATDHAGPYEYSLQKGDRPF